MAKIISVTPMVSEFVETDGEPWGDYRRSSADSWEQRMGESWEPLYSCEELEAEYQRFKNHA